MLDGYILKFNLGVPKASAEGIEFRIMVTAPGTTVVVPKASEDAIPAG
jgi:hypothetical protein